MIGYNHPMPRPLLFKIVLGAFLASMATALPASDSTISLEGTWRFSLDRQDVGETERWFQRELPEAVKLPGSLQEQRIGEAPSVETKWTSGIGMQLLAESKYDPYRQADNFKIPFWLIPDAYYVGAAWYQREVTIPPGWEDKRVVLYLERPHWETTLWVDDQPAGSQNSLGVPHVYDLTGKLSPGKHRLTLRVDNRMNVEVGVDAHSVSDQTQGNWNGVVGKLQLEAKEKVWIENVQVYPDIARGSVKVVAEIGNATGQEGRGLIAASAASHNSPRKHRAPLMKIEAQWGKEGGQAQFEYELGPEARLWDEFSPTLYQLKLELTRHPVPGQLADQHTVTFGLRQIDVQGAQFLLNGRPLFLRGTLECCIFPLTGYPPTDLAAWKRILKIARAHGLNHLRFHSWCPPEAAFVAADEMGFYYQVEVSCWANFGDGKKVDAWVYEESERMVRHLGNHPSFLLMAPSNEPSGAKKDAFLGKWIEYWRAKDPRRKYTAGSGWPKIPQNDFHVTHESRGLPAKSKPGTALDYSPFMSKQDKPIISHEIGQYCVYPNLDEIRKYKGALRPRNLEIFRDFLAKSGLLEQAPDFLRASGKLQVDFYKEEIEACLRTPGWGGFQLLDLHDFPGQGTAPVGVLDAFWEEKGYIKPREYRRFCDETVPLARLQRRVYTTAEDFEARVEVAHFGPGELRVQPEWIIRTASGRGLRRGQLASQTLLPGKLTSLGTISWPLQDIPQAVQLNLEVRLPGTRFANDWNFWVFPPVAETPAEKVLIADHLSEAVRTRFEQGGKVLLLPGPRRVAGSTLGALRPIFWNRVTFPSQKEHTVGMICDPSHPALQGFPTASHSDWQWFDILEYSKPMVLTSLARELRPIAQPIDDWNEGRKLGLIFEGRVGQADVLVCSVDFTRDLEQRPAARQLRQSLLRYVAGDHFHPSPRIDAAALETLFRQPSPAELAGARVIRANSAQPGYPAAHILDGDAKTLWHTAWGEGAPGCPHEVVIGMEQEMIVKAVVLTPRQDNNQNGWIKECALYLSRDGQDWGAPAARGLLEKNAQPKILRIDQPTPVRFIKLEALSTFSDAPYVSLAELEIQ